MTLPVGSITGTLRLLGASEFNAGIMGAQRSMDLAAGSASKMAGAVNEQDAAMTRSAAQAAKLRALSLSLTAAEERHTAAVMSGNASTAKLASTEAAELRARVRLADATAASTRSIAAMGKTSTAAAAEVSTLRTGLASTIETAGKLGLAFGAFELIKKAIDIGKESASYQRSMKQISALTGASEKQIAGLNDSLLAMSKQYAQAPEDLATSLYHAYAIGLRGKDALDLVAAAAKGAAVGNADLEETTNALTSTVAAGVVGNQSYSKTMAQLLQIVGSGDMKLSQFNEALGTGGIAQLATYGVNLRDIGAALATFGDNNLRGAEAMTRLIQTARYMEHVVGPGAKALDDIGLSTQRLTADLQTGGLNKALQDLHAHLDAAGITGNKVGAELNKIFSARGAAGVSMMIQDLSRFDTKYAELGDTAQTLDQRFNKIKDTASFAFKSLATGAVAAGVELEQRFNPQLASVAHLIAESIPQAINVGKGALVPFVAVWHALDDVLGPLAGHMDDVAGFLRPIAPEAEAVAAAVLSMWLAYKGFGIATAAGRAIKSAAETGYLKTLMLRDGVVSSVGPMQASYSRMGASATAAGLQQQAAADKATAAQVRSAAVEAQAFSDETAASSASTDAQVADADERAAASLAAARAASIAATQSAAAAEEASAAIVAAGDAARFGWSSLAGPIGIAAAGVLTFVTLLHHSGQSAQEAAAQVNTYTDAIKADSGALGDNTRQAVQNALQRSGAAAAGRKLGISYDLITQAALGNAGAMAKVRAAAQLYEIGTLNNTAATRGHLVAAYKLMGVLGDQSGAVHKAADMYDYETGKAKDNTSATNANATAKQRQKAAEAAAAVSAAALYGLTGTAGVAAYQAALAAAQKNTAQTKAQTLAFQMENNAAALVNQALQTLAGQHLNNAQAQTALDQATLSLTQSLKKNGSSVADNTAKGVANRQAIDGAVSALQGKMTAEAQATGSTEKATAQYRANAKALLDQIGKLDGTKSAAYRYAQQLLKIPPVVPTKIDLQNAAALRALREVKAQVAALANSISSLPPIDLNKVGQRSTIAGRASGGGLPRGLAWVGEGGAELADNDGHGNVQIIPHNAAVAYARTAGINVPGYATGTPGAPKTVISRSGSHGLAGRLLFQEGDMIGRELIAGLQMHKGDLIATAGSVVDAMVKSFGHARSVVLSGIHKATAPDKGSQDALSAIIAAHLHTATDVIKNPAAVAARIGAPTAAATAKAVATQQHADIALANYRKLAAELRDVTKATNAKVAAANHDAHEADKAARNARNHAEDMASSTKAERAAKSAAEDHARALEREATQADNTAKRVAKAAKKQQDAVGAMASKAKSAYQKAKSAADAAAQAAQQDAQNMVASIAAQFATLQQDYDNMKSTIAGGLTAGSDLSTIWGKLGDDVQTASDNLDQANQALADAQAAMPGLAAAQQAEADATRQQTAAHQALTAALAAGDPASILAAQQAQTDAATRLAAAQAAVQAAQPTPDQIKAVADAQDKVTAAQKAYTAAKAADSAGGVASVLAGFAGSEKQFAGDLTHLKSMIGDGPAAQALITELSGLGDQAGDALAEGLINDPKSLQAILASMQQIQSIADGEGTQLATAFYQAGANSLMQLMQGIEDEYPSVAAALAPYAAQLAQMFNIPMPTPPSSSASAAAGKSVTAASDIASYYLVQDTANGKWYDVNPTAKTVHELTAAQQQRDIAAGATVNVRTSGVPHFAAGTWDAPGGPSLVGEMGAELVLGPQIKNLPRHSAVIPNNVLKGSSPFGDTAGIERRLDVLNARVASLAGEIGEVQARAGAALYDRAGEKAGARMGRYLRQF